MKIPEFTAEASLGPALGKYCGGVLFGNTRAAGVCTHAAVNGELSAQLPSLAKTSALLLLRFLWQTVMLILLGAGMVQLRNHCTG